MRAPTFDDLADELATKRGGYTLWVGAGAAKALCANAPTWKQLEDGLSARVSAKPPDDWEQLDAPNRLDWIAGAMGHASFRASLREHVVQPMQSEPINETVADAMAIIGARSASIVSFNIESFSALPFIAARGGAVIFRPYLRSHMRHSFHPNIKPGSACPPVYFPHGMLDTAGECVITASEYAIHRMSLAVTTAISLCLGGDLVIVGMSLGDKYLRDAVLQHRQWMRNVFWIGRQFGHQEWARAAGVHCVEVDHTRLWSGLAERVLSVTHDNDLAEWSQKGTLAGRAGQLIASYRTGVANFEQEITKTAEELAERPTVTAQELLHFASHLIDFGLPLPKKLLEHPTYVNAIDWRRPGGT